MFSNKVDLKVLLKLYSRSLQNSHSFIRIKTKLLLFKMGQQTTAVSNLLTPPY